ncbi:hypothetical protein LWI29_018138 [Acer saccharum]|uniref:Cytochrome b5 heme-binding domain-containing protein n=1 Tax=Acer saccharum TaxID=4024 RepID=A0AA39RPV2_ACESA|nr:hypothetical protein LWI29_018138 [Acer saccharum]
MADQRVFTLSEVAQHKSKNDCWFVINGRVLNVTKFLELHPGGEEVLIESAGKDATKEFENIGHSSAAKKLLIKYQVGFSEVTLSKRRKPRMIQFRNPVRKDGGFCNQE